MEIRIAVCDSDEEVSRDIRSMILAEHPSVVVRIFSSAGELLGAEEHFHIYFLDIMGIGGMEIARALRRKEESMDVRSIIIFVTGFSEHMEAAFDVGAFHYLLKPVDTEKFRHVLRRALEEIHALNGEEKYILISIAGSKDAQKCTRKILMKDIIYVESNNKKVTLHSVGGIYEVQGTMKEFEDLLGGNFYRCHRYYLINFAKVSAYSQNDILMENGDRIMIAYRKYPAFIKAYLSYARGGGAVNV